MIVDAHVHVSQVDAEWNRGTEWFGREMRRWRFVYDEDGNRQPWRPQSVTRDGVYTSDAEALIASMDEAGIQISCLLTSDHRRVAPSPDKPGPYTTNDYCAKVVGQAPDRFVGIASLDPLRGPAEAVRELERCVTRLGMKGLKLYPTYDQFFPDDERIFPIYQKALELDIPVLFHQGRTLVKNAPMKYQPPHLLDEIGIRFPDLKVLVCHLGYPWWEECLVLVARHENFYTDISACCIHPPEFLLRMLTQARDFVGLDRVLFGSEQGLCNQASYVRLIKNLNRFAGPARLPALAPDEIEMILGRNAARLFGIRE